MKDVAQDYLDEVRSGVSTLVYCVRIERTDGAVLAFTNHDGDLTMSNGRVYTPQAGGADATAITSTSDATSDTIDLEGVLTDNGVSRDDIRAGLFSFAAVFLFRTRWTDPVEDDEPLGAGFLGETELRDDRYTATISGRGAELQQNIGRTHLPTCDAELGDSRCKVDVEPMAVTGSLVVTDQLTVEDSNLAVDDDYLGAGLLTITSGDNAGFTREIATQTGTTITLWRPFPYRLEGGENYSATPGCRKRHEEDCVNKFDNAINFRGFPFLPGRDAVTRFGGQ